MVDSPGKEKRDGMGENSEERIKVVSIYCYATPKAL
jgi:hypothetical protein